MRTAGRLLRRHKDLHLSDQVWDGIKTGSLACLFAVGIYCMVVGAITTVDQLAAHITAGCEKGGQHGTE